MRRLLLFCAVVAVALPLAYVARWAFKDEVRFLERGGWR